MPDDLRPFGPSLETLKKQAKRWLAALRTGDPGARMRLEHAIPNASSSPTLRDVQLALARELGFAGWAALKQALAPHSESSSTRLREYEQAAEALIDAYRSGTPEAMERYYSHTWHRRSWDGMRTYVQLDLGKRPSNDNDNLELSLDEARYLVAREYGYKDWAALQRSVETTAQERILAKPVRVIHPDSPGPMATSRQWDVIVHAMRQNPSARLVGQMTDSLLTEICNLETITELDLSGSKALTDQGFRQLARLPRLRFLDLRNTNITDQGLQILRELPALEWLSLAMTPVTDEGVAHLAHCDQLQHADLAWTRTGDAAIRALAGKSKLSEFRSGYGITDSGLSGLHELPVFKTWQGGRVEMELLSYRAKPNQLLLRGSFSDQGMRHLEGLDGLFALDLNDRSLDLSSAALRPLLSLPHLGWLAVDAKDDWMPYIAQMPELKFLGVQDTTAGDDGFVALGRSKTIEYIWGRRCHNLRRRGFRALAELPRLRGLSVSCLNVDDIGIAMLPAFPALKELMPMDIPDEGYRHIGGCRQLESLILMYCRDTTDRATSYITNLNKLSYYFNSYTTITDQTPALLSSMDSLERITLDRCHELTNSGIAHLSRLPRLRELRVSGKRLTRGVQKGFRPEVSVIYEQG